MAEPHPVAHEKPRFIGRYLKTNAFRQNRVRAPFRLVRHLFEVIPHPARLGKVTRKTERGQTRAHRLVHEEDAPLVIGADDALGQCPNRIDDRQARNGAPPSTHIEGERSSHAEDEERRIADEEIRHQMTQHIDGRRGDERHEGDLTRHDGASVGNRQRKPQKRRHGVYPQKRLNGERERLQTKKRHAVAAVDAVRRSRRKQQMHEEQHLVELDEREGTRAAARREEEHMEQLPSRGDVERHHERNDHGGIQLEEKTHAITFPRVKPRGSRCPSTFPT